MPRLCSLSSLSVNACCCWRIRTAGSPIVTEATGGQSRRDTVVSQTPRTGSWVLGKWGCFSAGEAGHQRGGRFAGTANQQQRGGHRRGGQGRFKENRDATRAENHIRHRYRPLREDAFSYDSNSSQSVCVFPRLTCCYVGRAGPGG